MSQENSNFELPEELRNIPPVTDKKRCLEIATSIWNFENQTEKYTVFLAQDFFKKNIFSFSKEEFSTIINNKLFGRKYPGQTSYDILKKCGQDGILYPTPLHNWFDNGVSYQDQLRYLKVINDNNNKEQLEFFNKKSDRLIEDCFEKIDNPCDALIEIVVSKKPQNIFKAKSWSDEQIAQWIKEHPESSRDIFNHVNSFSKNITNFPKSKKQLYFNIVNNYISNENPTQKEKDLFISSLISYPLDYIHYLEENHTNLFNKLITKKFSYSSSDNSVMNGIQSIILNRKDSFNQTINTFGKYKDLVKEDVIEEVGMYTKKTSFFEFCLRKQSYRAMTLFDFDDNLKDEEKEVIVAGICMHIKDCDQSSTSLKSAKNEIVDDWYSKILIACSDELYSTYMKKLKKSDLRNPKIIKELEAVELSRVLDEKPSDTTVTKRLKV
jgi:hypothetical protein